MIQPPVFPYNPGQRGNNTTHTRRNAIFAGKLNVYLAKICKYQKE